MAFDLEQWKERVREHLDGWWLRAERAGFTSVYASLSAAAIWPVVHAATAKGELAPALVALGQVTAAVGANLIAEQVQRWKDRPERVSEADVGTWVEAQVARDRDVRAALDDILERLEAVTTVRAALDAPERRAFDEALRADLARLGNGRRFEAHLHGAGAIAQGDRAVAAGAGGVAAGRDIRNSVVTTGDVFDVISRLRPGAQSKEKIDREIGKDRESWDSR